MYSALLITIFIGFVFVASIGACFLFIACFKCRRKKVEKAYTHLQTTLNTTNSIGTIRSKENIEIPGTVELTIQGLKRITETGVVEMILKNKKTHTNGEMKGVPVEKADSIMIIDLDNKPLGINCADPRDSLDRAIREEFKS